MYNDHTAKCPLPCSDDVANDTLTTYNEQVAKYPINSLKEDGEEIEALVNTEDSIDLCWNKKHVNAVRNENLGMFYHMLPTVSYTEIWFF